MPKPQWRILVESRNDVMLRERLDLIADTITAQGYQVVRWRGPLSGRVGYSRLLLDCDLAIVCNGTTPHYSQVLAHFARTGAAVLFVELGWYPQATTLQIDGAGINADASWVRKPLSQSSHTPLRIRSAGDLLVLLQHEQDTQITCHSPHFSGMSGFLEHLGAYSELPIRVRPHPKFPPSAAVKRLVTQYGMTWDDSPSLKQILAQCRAVACINSSGAVEALAAHLPVICFGDAIYRQPGAVYCMHRVPSELALVTHELREGRSSLTVERVEAMLQRILTQQWTTDLISARLPDLVDSILSQRREPSTQGRVTWRDMARAAPTWWTTYLRPKLQRTLFPEFPRNRAIEQGCSIKDIAKPTVPLLIDSGRIGGAT